MNKHQYDRIMAAIDDAHACDPRQDKATGTPYELAYARRMSEWLERVAPDADPALRIAARAQHFRRWESPREEYPMTRPGYHAWRTDLQKRQASLVAELLSKEGVAADDIDRVSALILKQNIKTNPEMQALEDIIALAFLDYYVEDFAEEHDDDKLGRILARTWAKMSAHGHQLAGTLTFSPRLSRIMTEALPTAD